MAAGERVLSPAVEKRLANARQAPNGVLSTREVEVLEWVARGESNRAIAKRLYISEATVKTHLLHLFAKLGVGDRTAAVTEAARLGILRLDHRG